MVEGGGLKRLRNTALGLQIKKKMTKYKTKNLNYSSQSGVHSIFNYLILDLCTYL